MSDLQRRFEMQARDGRIVRFSFAVIGRWGALEFWFVESPPLPGFPDREKYYGGIESHWNTCPSDEWWGGKEPSHRECYVLGNKPCWHDGSSLQASEHWIPGMLQGGSDWIWKELEFDYEQRMKPRQEPANDNQPKAEVA